MDDEEGDQGAAAEVFHVEPDEQFVDEVGGHQGAAREVLHGEPDEEVLNVEHAEAGRPDVVYTRGVVLTEDEGTMLGLVLTINDGYIGAPFVHHLTETNVTSKQIPKFFLFIFEKFS